MKLGLILLLLFSTISPAAVSFRWVKLVRVIDGDTFVVDLPSNLPPIFGKNISIRLLHIDAAEMSSKDTCEKQMAIKAKLAVNSILANARRIDLENVKRDMYFRLLADVIVTSKINKRINLSNYLLENDYAVHYDGGTKSKVDWCKKGKINGN